MAQNKAREFKLDHRLHSISSNHIHAYITPTLMSRYRTVGEEVWKHKMDKINAELFILSYGAIVSQLCADFDYNYPKVNKHLEKMGYNIGSRLIEEVLAKSELSRCQNFKDTADAVSKVGFKMFLNITPTISNWSSDNKQFSLILTENPLNEFVELPDERAMRELWYSNILVGILKGALEMVQLRVDAEFVSDVLQGAAQTEIKVRLIKVLEDEIPPEDR